jgi:hypothetical protein
MYVGALCGSALLFQVWNIDRGAAMNKIGLAWLSDDYLSKKATFATAGP